VSRQTVYGIVCDRLGLSGRQELVQGPTRPELRFSAWSTPSMEVRSVQSAQILIEEGHGGEVLGEVIHLQRDSSERLWAVAHVDSSIIPAVNVRVGDETVVVEHDLFWSAERASDLYDRDIEIRSIALTRRARESRLRRSSSCPARSTGAEQRSATTSRSGSSATCSSGPP
jgi:hypothetical protein